LFADIFNHEIHQKHEMDAGDLWNSSLRFFVWFVYFVVHPFHPGVAQARCLNLHHVLKASLTAGQYPRARAYGVSYSGRRRPPRFDDMRRRKPRMEKLERFVNFKPQTPLPEIIRLTAE
jgi:hypothetical protein